MYEKLAPLSGSTEIIGYVTGEAAAQTGLAEGTPVTAGLFDVVSCALGSGVYDDSQYSMIAGTWNINSGIEQNIVSAIRIPNVPCLPMEATYTWNPALLRP